MKTVKSTKRLSCIALTLVATGSYINAFAKTHVDESTSSSYLSAPAQLSKEAAALSPDPTEALTRYWTPERRNNAMPLPLIPSELATGNQENNTEKSDSTTIIEPTLPLLKNVLPNELKTKVIENTDGLKWDNAESSAARINGKLYLTMTDGQGASCSASVVASAGKSLITTASHCVRDKAGFYKNFSFYPGYSKEGGSEDPYGKWGAVKIFSATPDGHGGVNDVAFIVLKRDNHGRLLEEVTGASGLIFNISPNKAEQLSLQFGYPSNRFSANELTYCYSKGTYTENWLKIPCDMGPGSSGGPLVADYADGSTFYGYTFGVGSVSYIGTTPTITGNPTFGNVVKKVYEEAGKLQ